MKRNLYVPAIAALMLLITVKLWAGGVNLDQPVMPGVIHISVVPEIVVDIPEKGAGQIGVPSIDQIIDKIGAVWVERTFPHSLPPANPEADLTTIYNIRFSESLPVEDVCEEFSASPDIEFAVPWLIHRIQLDHNDPQRNVQYALNLIHANDAHDLTRGDPSAVVAIVDTGVDLDHSDLAVNIWLNPGEDLNGNGRIENDERNDRDDDGNGKRDDFHGWDFYANDGDGDNDPNDISGHGTHCAGCASAVTNNRVGISSIGYSCSIMAVRSGSGMVVTHGYQGIEYAARSGAGVISCSWGGGGRNLFTDRVIAYADEQDAMVIASAGNENSSNPIYPAGYDYAIAVAATDDRDRRANFSNYGDWVDISAPGISIRSTYVGNRYADLSGTSMSCPIVAGAAILLRAMYPAFNAEEIREILLNGADNIDDLNPNYRGELGSGRLNAYESLLLGAVPVLAVEDFDIIDDDNHNRRLDPGETVSIAVTISNDPAGEPTESLIVILSSPDPTIEFKSSFLEFPNLEPGEEFTNDEDPFVLEVSEEAVPHTSSIRIDIAAEPAGLQIYRDYTVIIGHPNILIVDDDGGDQIETIYTQAVENMGLGWVKWDVQNDYSPNIGTLLDYRMVIWLTGHAVEPLDDLDRWQMESALEEGVNMLLIGKNIGDNDENQNILRNYFGASHEEDSVRVISVKGLPGDKPLPEDIQLLLIGGDIGNGASSPSTMSPVRGADSLMIYMRGETPTGLAGVYRIDGRTESRTMYLGFAFGSSGERAGLSTRSEVLSHLYEWFMSEVDVPFEETDQPVVYGLDPAYPNPFNSTVRIGFTILSANFYRLSVLDVNGREVSVLGEGNATERHQIFTWNAGNAASGVYLLNLDSPGSQTMRQKIILVR